MVYQRNSDVVKRNVAGEVFLIPIRNKLADMRNVYVLHGIGEFVWDRLEDGRDVSGIFSDIVANFDVEEGEAKRDLDDHLAELLEADLVRAVGGG